MRLIDAEVLLKQMNSSWKSEIVDTVHSTVRSRTVQSHVVEYCCPYCGSRTRDMRTSVCRNCGGVMESIIVEPMVERKCYDRF